MNAADPQSAIFRGAFFRMRSHEPGQSDDSAVYLHLDVCRIDEGVFRESLVDLLADPLVRPLVMARAARVLVTPAGTAPAALPGVVASKVEIVVIGRVVRHGGYSSDAEATASS